MPTLENRTTRSHTKRRRLLTIGLALTFLLAGAVVAPVATTTAQACQPVGFRPANEFFPEHRDPPPIPYLTGEAPCMI